jgi:hypothetical protein
MLAALSRLKSTALQQNTATAAAAFEFIGRHSTRKKSKSNQLVINYLSEVATTGLNAFCQKAGLSP